MISSNTVPPKLEENPIATVINIYKMQIPQTPLRLNFARSRREWPIIIKAAAAGRGGHRRHLQQSLQGRSAQPPLF